MEEEGALLVYGAMLPIGTTTMNNIMLGWTQPVDGTMIWSNTIMIVCCRHENHLVVDFSKRFSCSC